MPLALVTGAGQRLGAYFAALLAENGYDLLLHTHTTPADATADAVRRQGRSATPVTADLTQQTDVARLAEAAADVDVLINNAAAFLPDTAAAPVHLTRHVLVNALAPLALIAGLKKGQAINLLDADLSAAGDPFYSYTLSKQLLRQATHTTAAARGGSVRVNGLALGPTLCGVRQSQAHFDALCTARPGGQTRLDSVSAALLFLIRNPVTGTVIDL